MLANQSAPLRIIGGHVGERLHVVDQRRATPQPAFRRERRAGTRRAAFAFDRGHQRRLLAADKRAGADAQINVEVEGRFKDAAAQQAVLFRLLDRRLQPADRQRILRAHVNEALVRPHRVSRDGHAFQHAVRVALQHAAVHERAGIPFVGVANDVFLLAGRLGDRRPLEAGRIARAAAPAQPALDHRIQHFLGGHLPQHVVQGLVTVGRDVGLDALRVHEAAVGQHDGHLLREERMLRVAALHLGLAAFECADERSRVFRRDLLVKRPLALHANLNRCALAMRVHLHQRALAAQLHAADPAHFDLVFQAGLFDRFVQGLFDALRVGGHAARRHAAADDIFLPRGAFLLRNLDQVINYHGRSILSLVRAPFRAFAAA